MNGMVKLISRLNGLVGELVYPSVLGTEFCGFESHPGHQ